MRMRNKHRKPSPPSPPPSATSFADSSNFTGEQHAVPNNRLVRGFKVIDKIKTSVENACPRVVSCADILAIAARDSVVILGGSNWNVKLERRDARTANRTAANNNIPPPTSSLANLTAKFAAQGLSTRDMVALSGMHLSKSSQSLRSIKVEIEYKNKLDVVGVEEMFAQDNASIRACEEEVHSRGASGVIGGALTTSKAFKG